MDRSSALRAARFLTEQHGICAEAKVLDRMRELSCRNDTEGFAVWANILAAINELRRTGLRNGERTH